MKRLRWSNSRFFHFSKVDACSGGAGIFGRITFSLPPSRCQVGFFLLAEDGIRVTSVTGVQTCALPIYFPCRHISRSQSRLRRSEIPSIDPPLPDRDAIKQTHWCSFSEPEFDRNRTVQSA